MPAYAIDDAFTHIRSSLIYNNGTHAFVIYYNFKLRSVEYLYHVLNLPWDCNRSLWIRVVIVFSFWDQFNGRKAPVLACAHQAYFVAPN